MALTSPAARLPPAPARYAQAPEPAITACHDLHGQVMLLWLAIITIKDKRARERADRRTRTSKRSDVAEAGDLP
jgi:hypothetical protein